MTDTAQTALPPDPLPASAGPLAGLKALELGPFVGPFAGPFASKTLPGLAPSNAYRCADGQVVIDGNGASIFKRLVLAIGRDDLGQDPAWPTTPGAIRSPAPTLGQHTAQVLGALRVGNPAR